MTWITHPGRTGSRPRAGAGLKARGHAGPPEGGPTKAYAVVIEDRYHCTVCFRPSSNDTVGA